MFSLFGFASVVVALRLVVRLRYGLRKLFAEDILIIVAWVSLSICNDADGSLRMWGWS